ncbi:MAG: hypothetical protein U0821_18815 [Chloroflexota bacterium]
MTNVACRECAARREGWGTEVAAREHECRRRPIYLSYIVEKARQMGAQESISVPKSWESERERIVFYAAMQLSQVFAFGFELVEDYGDPE